MINFNVIVWLLTGGMVGWLAVLQNGFTTAAMFVSFIAAMASLGVFRLIRAQPVR